MISDTEIVEEVKRFMDENPYAKALDIVEHFYKKGLSKEMIIYILKEIVNDEVRDSGR